MRSRSSSPSIGAGLRRGSCRRRPTNSVTGIGDDAERVGERELAGRAAARSRRPRSAANCVISVERVERVDADEAHLRRRARRATAAKSASSAGARRAGRVPEVDDHRPAVGASVDRADRRRRSRSTAGSWSVGERRVGRRARLDVLAGLVEHGVGRRRRRTRRCGSRSTAPTTADDDGRDEHHELRTTGVVGSPRREATERPARRAPRRHRWGGVGRRRASATLTRADHPISSTTSSGRGCLGGRPHGACS